MNRKPIVCVLMSTYNGSSFLRQQLDSIFDQEQVDVKLVVRDDGSKDNSVEILRQYNIHQLMESPNVGCEKSFKELLYLQIEADYYAFADQDDVWHPRKLIAAIEKLEETNSDLYVCNLKMVDAELEPIGEMFTAKNIARYDELMRKYAFTNLHGCVQVWTNRLHKELQAHNTDVVYPHDVWVNLVANVISSTYVDPIPYIKYRLHGNNTSGIEKTFVGKIKKGIKFYLSSNPPRNDRLAQSVIDWYGQYLDKDSVKYKSIYLLANYQKSIFAKIRLIFSGFVWRNDFSHAVLYIIGIIQNKY